MKRWVQYSRMVWRMGVSCLLRVGIWLIVFLLIGGGFFAAYLQLSSQEKAQAQITVAFALPEEDEFYRQMFSFARTVPSVASFCDIRVMEEKEALRQMEEGNVQMLAVIPSSFLQQAAYMEETQFKVYVPQQMTLREKKFIALLRCVESGMETAECAILSVYPEIDNGHIKVDRRKLENDLLTVYVDALLQRGAIFEAQQLSAFGKVHFVQYYLVDVVLLGLLLMGALYLDMYTRETFMFESVAAAGGTVRYVIPLIRAAVIGIQLFLVFAGLAAAGNAVCSALGSDWLVLDSGAFGELFVTAVSAASVIHLTACTGQSALQRKMLYYVLVFVLALLSGGLLPIYYLPGVLQKIAHILPYYQWHQGILHALWPNEAVGHLLPLIGVTAVLLAPGIVFYQKRLRT